MILRRMEVVDIEPCLAINAGVYTPDWQYKDFLQEVELVDFSYPFVLEHVTIVGYGVIRFNPPEAEILNIAVAQGVQNQGWGRKLLLHALSYVQLKKVQTVFLEAKESNKRAIGFYEKMGFTVSGKRLNYYKDGAAAILMVNVLEVG
jgi:ribosomal-protein-alanine acetyltransferase